MSTFDKLNEFESPQARAVREEIEALPKFAIDELDEDMKHPGEPDTVRPEWEDQRIRIEALRAAARLIGAAVAAEQPLLAYGQKIDPVTATKNAAEQFVAWLETGER